MRYESDFLGEVKLSDDIAYGIHTHRAKSNFTVTNYIIDEDFIKAIIKVKKAAMITNHKLKYISDDVFEAINRACDFLIYSDSIIEYFPLDPLQGGAGTSLNMNVNEVLANLALKNLGKNYGDYHIINPIETINLHQSTNDVYPTALKISVIEKLRETSKVVANLQDSFQQKEREFSHVVKIGRTEKQPATPITLGAEFSAFAESISRDRWRIFKCEERIRVVNIGGTSVGTGITAPREYIFMIIEELREITGLGISRGENLIDATANSDAFVEISGNLKACASNVIKICDDLRNMNMLGEIKLPKVQAGSSIMPTKVNPVILESVIQAMLKISANDLIIFETTSRSSFQINEFMPLLSFTIIESLSLLQNSLTMLNKHILDIKCDEDKCKRDFENNEILLTVLLPKEGYNGVQKLIKEYQEQENISIREFLNNKYSKEFVDDLLSPDSIMSLGFR